MEIRLAHSCTTVSPKRYSQKLQPQWKRQQKGLGLTSHDCTPLTNLRFTDGVLLFAQTLPQLTKMLQDISTEAMKVGLELHPDKTKILHNQQHRRTRQQPEQTNVNGMNIEILPYSSSQKYLGRRFTFQDPMRNEIESRIAAGWRKFCLLKHELTTKTYSIKDRLRLFHGTITPTILYGCSSWTLTGELENRLRRTQRQMLRMIINPPRRRLSESEQHNKHINTQMKAESDETPNDMTTHDYATQLPISSDSNSDGHDVDSDTPDIHFPADANNEPTESWVDWIKRAIQ